MEFKRLELESEPRGIRKLIKSESFRRSLLYISIGAVAGFLLFFFSEGQLQQSISFKDVLKSAGVGGFFGFFIANSPCARNRC